MNKKINPTGLKGKKDITNRMVELMGLNESDVKQTPVHSIKLTKKGPDGKAYGIIKENNKYFIKTANINKDGLVEEQFSYIGGLKNKIKESYPSYSKATRELQNKFTEIAKQLNTVNESNVLRNDHLLVENYSGVAIQGMTEVEEETKGFDELYEITDLDEATDGSSDDYLDNKREEISNSMNEIDALYESVIGKKKILK